MEEFFYSTIFFNIKIFFKMAKFDTFILFQFYNISKICSSLKNYNIQ